VTPNPVFNAAFVEYVSSWSPVVAATVNPRPVVPQIGSNPQNLGPI
jgi:hypothetical protein